MVIENVRFLTVYKISKLDLWTTHYTLYNVILAIPLKTYEFYSLSQGSVSPDKHQKPSKCIVSRKNSSRQQEWTAEKDGSVRQDK